MKLKSYFASTVEAAMALASHELGPDAMLVNSRRTTEGTRQLGEYEVVFALLPGEAAPPPPVVAPPPTPVAAKPLHSDPVVNLSLEISDLKERIDRMTAYFDRAQVTSEDKSISPAPSELLTQLLDADVEQDIANDIANRAIQYRSDPDALALVLRDLIHFDSTLGRAGTNRRIVAVVGPPGSGKTTTLIKFAARFGVAAKRPSHFLSTDTVRIAAADQLRSYATILGSSFQLVDTANTLTAALDEHRHTDFILIDTPGVCACDLDSVRGFAEILANDPEIDVHLTIPASMRVAELSRVIAQYEMFHPRKLIFTRLDETCTAGVLINEAIRTGLPVSFLTTGQQVPEDLEPASAGVFSGLLRHVVPNSEILAGAQND